ncbi:hypothetical protein [Methanobrevibacter sp. DSM 116169]|uniref:hypothetical protein n=1 Tax=Methanobrevibacter sp. DSM 116169 TaxID=3242727 RepID=UPI0038FC5F96
MSEISYVFNFRRVNTFIRDMNRSGCFDLLQMDGVNQNYRIVLSSSCPDNIVDCLDVDGTLKVNVVEIPIGDDGLCVLQYNEGLNNNSTISLGQNQVNMDVGDGDVYLKAVFIVDNSTGYVLAYDILNRVVPINNEVTLPVAGVLWSIITEAE